MRVFVTAHSSRYGGGVSVAKNLIAAFGRVASEHEYFFTVPPALGFEECCEVAPKHETLVYHTSGLFRRWCWDTVELPTCVHRFRPQVIFNISNRGFVSPPCPQATLIQDPHLLYPSSCFGQISWLEGFKFWYHRQYLRKSTHATQLFFCQTPVAEGRLRSMYGNGFMVKRCPNQLSVFMGPAPETVSEPYPLHSLRGKFRLFVLTRYYTHKNLEIILRTFKKHRDALHDVAVVLTIAPDQHHNAARLLKDVNRAGLDENIMTVGALGQGELDAYYTHTDALFLPTLLESFSGTYIEAMQFGRPILTSDMDFAHAVCGDAALYFDPHDENSVCDSILRLKDDPSLYHRLVEAGKAHRAIQSLSWDDISRNVIRELELLVENKGRAE